MTVDYRREVNYVWKQHNAFYATIGEEVVWFKFDTVESRYDDIYDEGFKQYQTGIRIPALWVDQIEDQEQYSGEGRRPTKRLRFAVSSRALQERGVPIFDAHGRRVYDVPPVAPDPEQYGRPDSPWLDDRVNDVVFYDGRFFAISDFQVRGRAKEFDQIIGVSAIEIDPRDENLWDLFPWNTPWGDPVQPADSYEILDVVARVGDGVNFDVNLAADLSGSTWLAVVEQVSGSQVTQMAEFDVDTSDQANGNLVLSLPVEAIGTLSIGMDYRWKLVQQFPDREPNIVMRGSFKVIE